MASKKDYLKLLREGESLRPAQLCSMILRLSLPAILAQISTIIMQYIDASMVGRLGAGGSASIGLVASTTWLMNGIGMGAGMGFTVQCAQRIGAGDERDARGLMRQGMFVTLLVSAAVGAVVCALSARIPAWLGAAEEIRRGAASYLFIFALFFPVDRINFSGGGFLQASGNMIVPGLLHVMMCVLDVVFNALLIFPSSMLPCLNIRMPGAGLGVTGAALGTAFAKVCSMAIMVWYLYRRSAILHLRAGERFALRRDQILKGIRIAVPVAAEKCIENSAQIVGTRIVAPLGTVAVAAHSLAVTAESLCYMPGYGMSAAATAVIGQSIGAGRRDLTKKLGWITTLLGMAVMTVSGVLMYIAAPYMFRLLTPVPEVIALGTRILRIEAFAEPLFAASIVAAGVMRGGGDTLIPALLNLFSMWCVRIPLALLLTPALGLTGMWLAMCIELCVRGALFLVRQAQGKYAAGSL